MSWIGHRFLQVQSARSVLCEATDIDEYKKIYMSILYFCTITTNIFFLLREVVMPSIIVLNMTIDGYFLPESKIETIEDLLLFLNRVLDGSATVWGAKVFSSPFFSVKTSPSCAIQWAFSNKIPFTLISYSEEMGICSALRELSLKRSLLWWWVWLTLFIILAEGYIYSYFIFSQIFTKRLTHRNQKTRLNTSSSNIYLRLIFRSLLS